jgi:putative mycofactocin binding protein MftB
MPADDGFDLDAGWTLNPQVALRPERFGALCYHFGTRRLSFLKSRTLLAVVQELQAHPSALAACESVGVTTGEQAGVSAALARLSHTDFIVLRGAA